MFQFCTTAVAVKFNVSIDYVHTLLFYGHLKSLRLLYCALCRLHIVSLSHSCFIHQQTHCVLVLCRRIHPCCEMHPLTGVCICHLHTSLGKSEAIHLIRRWDTLEIRKKEACSLRRYINPANPLIQLIRDGKMVQPEQVVNTVMTELSP